VFTSEMARMKPGADEDMDDDDVEEGSSESVSSFEDDDG
jgi:hypothetical protein